MCFPRCTSKNKGFPIKQIKQRLLKRFDGWKYEEVNRYTCPDCGAIEVSIVTNGTPMTQARYNALAAS